MKHSHAAAVLLASALVTAIASFPAAGLRAGEKTEFAAAGEYVEGCSCTAICPCEVAGLKMGCLGVGAMKLSGGSYRGVDLTGASIAYATKPGTWVRLYVQAAGPEQQKGLEAFAKAVYADWGKLESIKSAKIGFSGEDGKYVVTVNGGSIMRLETKPVIGADNKTAISINNVKDPLNSTFYQGNTVSGSFKDGTRTFKLKDTNSFFNNTMNASGKI